MSVTSTTAPPPEPADRGAQGIYALPVVGPQFQRARDITEGLRPTDSDSAGQVVAKRVAQGSVIAGTAALTAIVVL